MKIILALFSFVIMMFWTVSRALGFTNTDFNTAPFTETNMVPAYKNPGTRQWGQRLANNAAAAYRLGGRSVIVNNESLATLATKVFDTTRDYRNSYIFWLGNASTDSTKYVIPYTETDNSLVRPAWLQITTAFQEINAGSIIHIRALNSGGFELKNTHPSSTYYTLGILTEMRLVTGA